VFTKELSRFLLASPNATVLSQLEPVLTSCGGEVEVVLSLDAAMVALVGAAPPILAVLDTALCCADPDMNINRLLASVRGLETPRPLSIVLISDTVTQTWIDRLADGVIDDLILRDGEVAYWQLRIEMVLRSRHKAHELEAFRESAMLNAQMDHLTGVYNREAILSLIFKETDRVQRSKGVLSLVLLDLDDFGHWNSRLGNDHCEDLLCQVAGRIIRLQRSYDLLGRPGMDEFLLVLPGCSLGNAAVLAERMRTEVFSVPFHVGGESIRLSACFGIASSKGRSPVVVLREAEQALHWARTAGPESIQCFGDQPGDSGAGVSFLSNESGDGLVAW
jgi:diguanylate cyclase (GGDEF)-like protein